MTAPTMTHSTPHHGNRICLSSWVITIRLPSSTSQYPFPFTPLPRPPRLRRCARMAGVPPYLGCSTPDLGTVSDLLHSDYLDESFLNILQNPYHKPVLPPLSRFRTALKAKAHDSRGAYNNGRRSEKVVKIIQKPAFAPSKWPLPVAIRV